MISGQGLDVSQFQRRVDWDDVPPWVDFTYIRGFDWRNDCVDAMARWNVLQASQGRAVGGYHRVDAVRREPKIEVNLMIEVLSKLGLIQPGCLYPAVDIEFTDDKVASAEVDWAAWANDFFTRWYAITWIPLMVYGSGSFIQDSLGDPREWDPRTKVWVGHTAKWMKPAGQTADQIAGKTPYTFGGRTVLHQFDHSASIPGITSPNGSYIATDRNQVMPGFTVKDFTISVAG